MNADSFGSTTVNYPRSILVAMFSPTGAMAKWLINRRVIRDFKSMLIWNCMFYLLLAITCVWFCVVNTEGGTRLIWVSYVAVLISFARINELMIAFYGDALPKPSKRKPSEPEERRRSLPIDQRARIILLTLAYLEIILLFAVIYYCLQNIYGFNIFHERLWNVFDAIYFSGITITTTGYGEYHPTNTVSRCSSFTRP
jgi:hypothetical protein